MTYLEKFKKYIEEENFLQALNVYELNDMNFLDFEELQLLKILAYSNFAQVHQANYEFKNSLYQERFSEARENLLKYREILQKYDIYRQTDFYELRINNLEQLAQNPHYAQIKGLYKEGLQLVLNKQYLQSLPYFEECLQYDQDHVFYVYLRLANAYQGLKDFKTARYFYEQALEISHEPSAFLKISRLAYFQKNYSLAITNSKEYLNRKRYEKFVYEHLKDYYLILGQADEVKFYNDQVLKLTFLGTISERF